MKKQDHFNTNTQHMNSKLFISASENLFLKQIKEKTQMTYNLLFVMASLLFIKVKYTSLNENFPEY